MTAASPLRTLAQPDRDCPRCPRLVAFRAENRQKLPDCHNAPVPSFGPLGAKLLIVGLAPGRMGANCTGRPFTGDWAGDLLYATLAAFGWASGTYAERADDGLVLHNVRITNAVRCVPPANKPIGAEIATCRPFLDAEMAAMPNLKAVLALGSIAHNAVLATCGARQSAYRFAHGELHRLPGGLIIADSYHCSRLNTNTGRLTEAMFHQVFAALATAIA